MFSRRRRHTRCALVTGVQTVLSSDLRDGLFRSRGGTWRDARPCLPRHADALLRRQLRYRLALSDARIAHDRAGAERRRRARELRRIVEPVRPRRLPARIARIAANRRLLTAVGRMNLRPDLATSEKHTSELQSLMPNSYAVLC